MTSNGIGGGNPLNELNNLKIMTQNISPTQTEEYKLRLLKLRECLQKNKVGGIYINAGTNLEYFTGVKWPATERMVGAFLTSQGVLSYILPKFEAGSFGMRILIDGTSYYWDEHESPYRVIFHLFRENRIDVTDIVAIDPSAPYFLVEGIQKHCHKYKFISGENFISQCRSIKSHNEIDIMQCANNMTLEVQKSAASILYKGITASEVEDFINQAHRKVGASGSSFCIVLFGKDTSYPHGVQTPKPLEDDDIVIIDTGCTLYGYQSDITRCYIFGEPTEKQLQVWQHEKEFQQIAFNAAKIGGKCCHVDDAVRNFLSSNGYGPGYALPGVAHRTGHGIGMDIHESPYLVGNDDTTLVPGMCFSNEPMLIIPEEFGIRHEDHFYMTESGPKWFTEPMESIVKPF
jgi:Xaa-Pro dipeptidase